MNGSHLSIIIRSYRGTSTRIIKNTTGNKMERLNKTANNEIVIKRSVRALFYMHI